MKKRLGTASGGDALAVPTGVDAGSLEPTGATGRAVIGRLVFVPRDVDRAATFHARVVDDRRAVRTEVEVVDREVAQGFEFFVQEVLVDDRLTVVARLHVD